MGTNENLKDINENIKDIEQDNVNNFNTVKDTKDIEQENNFNSNAQDITVEHTAENENEPNFQIINNEKNEQTVKFNMQETQRIDFLSEFLKENDNAKNEDITTNEIVGIDTEIQDGNTVKSKENLTKMENIEQEPVPVTKIQEQQAIQQTVQNANQEKDEFDEPKNRSSENVVEIDEKKHTQDKKDYRLEKMLFDRINKMQGKIKESLELIKKFERINAKEENLPNIVTTLHDKLTHEVIKQFRTVGIEFNMRSFLVQSIVSDLLSKFEEGITDFKNCSENLNFVREVQEDFESRVELVSTSKVKNLIARLRGLFKPERKQEKLEQLERERQEKKLEEANIHLIKYKFKNSELERYTIRKNIVSSLTREILHGQGSGLTLSVEEFIEVKVEPEMKLLGLDGLLPELKEELYKEFKEKNANIHKEDFEKMSIGEVKKNMKIGRTGYVRSKISTVVNNDVTEERMVV